MKTPKSLIMMLIVALILIGGAPATSHAQADSDDGRILSSCQMLNGAINSASDVDNYYFYAYAGQLASISMRKGIDSTLDSYLELYGPHGTLVRSDDDSGGNLNSLISRFQLPSEGWYRIAAHSFAYQSAGLYGLSLTTENGVLGVVYQAQVQSMGWMTPVSNGNTAGTIGQSLRLEALTIALSNAPAGKSIEYQVHVQDIGWMNPVRDGALAGTVGQSRRMEAICIRLIGGCNNYTIKYRVYVQDYGWMPWVSNGAIAGTVGQSRRIEAIQIQTLPPYK